MGYTLNSITARIRSRLNDQIGAISGDAVLIPFAQDAADELQLELDLYGIQVIEKKNTTPIPIPVNTLRMGSLLPQDMLEPQRLEERLSGSTDLFIPMVMRQWEPDILPTDSLRYWTYREQDIFFVGSTSARDVVIYYKKRAIFITDINSPININNSELFMICKTASLIARDVGENPVRADDLNTEAGHFLGKLVGIGVKSKQAYRTRRRPYTLAGRRRWI